ncbi:PREDICTED: probable phosphatase 2C [Prunus dulcis]|uniref:protein-serine/threonine phosphatase n=2 Tax=Prunus dulcis TaxID=3755 RepID=A0A5E4EM37_PRUDU|nr:PREDICTED: probable phosphatase 2C [Prunus dulcis]
MRGGIMIKPEGELKVSFGYQCNSNRDSSCEDSDEYETLPELRRNSSFSCLSGAALSANATLANTNICNGLIGAEILPSWDSPNSFRRVPSSPTLSRLDILSSSLQSSMSNLSCSPSTPDSDSYLLKSMSPPSRSEGFLNAMEVQVAGGAAGEDRVQAVCSEENGWLFCAIYDGFNGRDAADFLAGTLYETIVFYFNLLDWESSQESIKVSSGLDLDGSLPYMEDDSNTINEERFLPQIYRDTDSSVDNVSKNAPCAKPKVSTNSFRHGVLDSLQRALSQAENDFLYMVEQEMEDRPDLVSVGSCVLVVLLHGKDLYTLNLGDSRAVLATYGDGDFMNGSERLKAIQLTDSHTVDDEGERMRVLCDHPDDPMTIVAGRVKGKLKVTRAFGVGYLKKKKLNDALMGILQVRNLMSPPYVSTQPSLNVHRISKSDCFVVVGSDGLFDFFTNDEVVKLVHSYILSNPSGDPAKFLLEQLVVRAANCAGFSMEELMNIPAGRRRKYHDDVTVIVIILGTNQRTTKASTCVLGPQANDALMIKCVLQISDICQ